MSLSGRTALVTGGSGGIGRAAALELARRGADVGVHWFRGEERAAAVVREIEALGRRGIALRADVADPGQVEAMVEALCGFASSLDILVNAAGIARDYPALGMEPAEWDAVLAVNLAGTFHACRAAGRRMLPARRGRIVNVSSTVAQKGGRGQANYVASKGGVEALTRALAVELSGKGITVNAVAPGPVVTGMSAEVLERERERVLGRLLVKRFGTAEEVARVVAFLCSDDAAYITGQVIAVDGGFGLCP